MKKNYIIAQNERQAIRDFIKKQTEKQEQRLEEQIKFMLDMKTKETKQKLKSPSVMVAEQSMLTNDKGYLVCIPSWTLGKFETYKYTEGQLRIVVEFDEPTERISFTIKEFERACIDLSTLLGTENTNELIIFNDAAKLSARIKETLNE